MMHQVNNVLKSYNSFLITCFKYNKFSILLFSTATALGYLSLPHLEKYHKSVKEKSNNNPAAGDEPEAATDKVKESDKKNKKT